jgi:hypothetical protein
VVTPVPAALPTAAPLTVEYMPASSTPNAFRAAISPGARSALIAVLSTTVVSGQSSLEPAHDAVDVSIGASAPASVLHRSAVEQAPPPLAQSDTVGPAEVHPDDFYRDSFAALTRLAVRAPSPPARRRSAKSLGATLGSRSSFWVSQAGLGKPAGSYAAVPATLRATFQHAGIWVDDSLEFDAAALQQIGVDFETAYDSDSRHFGSPEYSETSPGALLTAPPCDASGSPIAGAQPAPILIPPANGRHVVLIVNQKNMGEGIGGYFSALNYLSQPFANCLNGHPPSNEASMIVLGYSPQTSLGYALNEDFVRSTAHELQHALNFVRHYVLSPVSQTEEAWIDEGLAMLAQDFAVAQIYGGSPNLDVADAVRHAQQFLSRPEGFSLTAFTGMAGSTPFAYSCSGCYGNSYLFARYLYDRFGGDAVAHALEAPGHVGAENLRTATGLSPETLIGDYGVALAVSGQNITSDRRFAFTAFNPYGTYTDQFNRTLTLSGPAVTVQAPGSTQTYAAYAGTFKYFTTQPNGAQGAGITVLDTTGRLNLAPALIQR